MPIGVAFGIFWQLLKLEPAIEDREWIVAGDVTEFRRVENQGVAVETTFAVEFVPCRITPGLGDQHFAAIVQRHEDAADEFVIELRRLVEAAEL